MYNLKKNIQFSACNFNIVIQSNLSWKILFLKIFTVNKFHSPASQEVAENQKIDCILPSFSTLWIDKVFHRVIAVTRNSVYFCLCQCIAGSKFVITKFKCLIAGLKEFGDSICETRYIVKRWLLVTCSVQLCHLQLQVSRWKHKKILSFFIHPNKQTLVRIGINTSKYLWPSQLCLLDQG